jgi:hypothetical protein
MMFEVIATRFCHVIVLVLAGLPMIAHSAEVPVAAEATIRGGSHAESDQSELGFGYLHVKYSDNVENARKSYFHFDVSALEGDLDKPAKFTVELKSHHKQAVHVWALRQKYDGFDAEITWNAAQANDANSNDMETRGRFTAARLGPRILAHGGSRSSIEVEIETLSSIVHDGSVTIVITGVDHHENDAGGLRLKPGSAKLELVEPE